MQPLSAIQNPRPVGQIVRGLLLLLIFVGLAGGASAQNAGGAAPDANPPAVTILDNSGFWRVLHSWAPPTGHAENGFLELRGTDYVDFRTQYPAPGWTEAGFDDSHWAWQHFFVKYSNGELDGRAGGGSPSTCLRQLSLRGKFTVADPAQVKSLWLDMAFRGGVVVHVNGKEVMRAYLPDKGLAHGVPADVYPLKAYVKPDGKNTPWGWFADPEEIAKEGIYELRVRRLEKLAIPPELLVKGTNVLAVEIHGAKFPPECFNVKGNVPWASCGVVEMHLRADRAEGIVPNVARPAGVQVWNCNLAAEVTENDWGDPHETLGPIRLSGAKNGSYTGKVVVSSDKPIRGLSASVTDLAPASGQGAKLPATAVRVGYGRLWGAAGARLRDDALVATPLPEVPVTPSGSRGIFDKTRQGDGVPPLTPGAVQCVYVTANIPKDAAPGDYRGTLTIKCEGAPDPGFQAPVELKVIDWALPDPADFSYWFGLIQSPEGVGLHYQVPLWSDKHFELIGKSMDLIGQTGGKVLFIDLIAETEYGNEHSMALWVKPEGADLEGQWWTKCTHDLTRIEKYVATAVKHLGKPTFVVLSVWQPCERITGPRVSVLDAKTGKIENVRGPKPGSPESLAFWKPVIAGVRAILDKAGIKEQSVLYGYASDALPDPKTARVFWELLPKAGWQAARHDQGADQIVCDGGESVAVRYTSNVWGQEYNADPKVKRVYGWNFTYAFRKGIRTWLDRTTYDSATFPRFRSLCEQVLMADRPGLGQIAADCWPPPPAKPGAYPLRTLYSRFPHSANVGSGNRGCTTNQLLYPAPDGAAPSVRFELVRENIQECEARIYLEKVLILAQMCPLKPDLMEKAQAVLDERTRWHRLNYNFHGHPDAAVSWPYSGWEDRTAKLYEAASEVEKALATIKKERP